ncbi:GtrA family protein [Methylomicrobium sp. RS1]|uniref:GtrA family protein n=1 Tax=Candidatus Methylomicrobium oryzae TaxID=2802053 RepID=UPI0019224D06|nr:GtrA family protein [Methylomicrobium sp. RS1]MBL1264980.1 GtrA family protein [Methylomicrobium sp. RS1]
MFVRFLFVGGIGFVIDAGITYLLIQQKVAPWGARVPAIILAMTFTWLANRYFTYQVNKPHSASEAVRYGIVSLSMASVNYLVYLLLVHYGVWPVASVTLATAFQTIISFNVYRYFVFMEPGGKMPNTNWLYNLRRLKLITWKAWFFDVTIYMTALAVLAIAMNSLHALDSGLSGSDEGSHFLNSFLIWSYLTEALGQNPLSYAQDFYVHYPKISIGHWPPLYYAFLSLFFFVLPHAPWPFLIINLMVGAFPALLVARVVRQVLGLPWAILAALTYVMSPIVLNNTVRLMLDQALAGLCFLAALIWNAYAKAPNLRLGIAYALAAAAAILVKGNGWVLGLFPLLHIALTGGWSLLKDWRTYLSGIIGLIIVGGWTLITYKISSDGFNYAWGVEYFMLAASTFLSALYANLGFWGLIAVILGIVKTFFSQKDNEIKEIGIVCCSLVMVTLLFHSIVPVDLDQRYMSSAVPPLVILMVIGVWIIMQQLRSITTQSWIVFPIALALFSIPGGEFLNNRPMRFDMHMDLIANEITKHPGGRVIVIDGNAGAEGALAAEVALKDSYHKNFVVRSSQLLAKSDFMGHRYALKVDNPEAVLRLLDSISCSAIVIADGPFITPRFAHSDLLWSALQLPSSPFKLKQIYKHERHKGSTYLFVRNVYVQPQQETIVQMNFSEKSLR